MLFRSASADNARFLFPFSTETLAVLKTFAGSGSSVSIAGKPYQMRPMWHESSATKRDGIIENKVSFPSSAKEVILNGSLIHVGNPFFKSPNQTGKREDEVFLDLLPSNYLPRTHYLRSTSRISYDQGIPALEWNASERHDSKYRIAFRNMLDLHSGRTLMAAVLPPGFAHVHTIESIAFKETDILVASLPLWLSLPFDFLVRTMGLKHFHASSLRYFPWVKVHPAASLRALRLNCLTTDYAELWNSQIGKLSNLAVSQHDPRFSSDATDDEVWPNEWSPRSALRSDFARRMALVEIDVLVSIAMGLTFEQLIEIYRTRFSVLREQESGTWYDANGNIVWTNIAGLSGIGYRKPNGKKPSATEWEELFSNRQDDLKCNIDIDFIDGGNRSIERVFRAPFSKCDREFDYRQAWNNFSLQSQSKAA